MHFCLARPCDIQRDIPSKKSRHCDRCRTFRAPKREIEANGSAKTAFPEKSFAFAGSRRQTRQVTLPLALVYCRRLMPGSQLVNRLQDLSYRVQSLAETDRLLSSARTDGPMLIFVDVDMADAVEVMRRLKADAETAHLPIVAFGSDDEVEREGIRAAPATLVVGQTALLTHLPGLLEQALRVE